MQVIVPFKKETKNFWTYELGNTGPSQPIMQILLPKASHPAKPGDSVTVEVKV